MWFSTMAWKEVNFATIIIDRLLSFSTFRIRLLAKGEEWDSNLLTKKAPHKNEEQPDTVWWLTFSRSWLKSSLLWGFDIYLLMPGSGGCPFVSTAFVLPIMNSESRWAGEHKDIVFTTVLWWWNLMQTEAKYVHNIPEMSQGVKTSL